MELDTNDISTDTPHSIIVIGGHYHKSASTVEPELKNLFAKSVKKYRKVSGSNSSNVSDDEVSSVGSGDEVIDDITIHADDTIIGNALISDRPTPNFSLDDDYANALLIDSGKLGL